MQYLRMSLEAENMKNKMSELGETLKAIPVGMSAAISKNDISYDCLLDICNSFSTGSARLLVLNHENSVVFEVARFDAEIPISAYYSKQVRKNENGNFNDSFHIAIEKVKDIIVKYAHKDVFQVAKVYPITQEQKNEGFIYYSYIQRSSVNLAAFRNIKGHSTSTEALKKVLRHLVDEGHLAVETENPLMYRIKGV